MKGHIRERSPGHWAIVIDTRDANGKRKRKWHSFTGTKRQAQNECARLISEINGGKYMEPNKTTLAQFFGFKDEEGDWNGWLGHMRSQVAPRTHERYVEICTKNLSPLLGLVILTKLQPVQIAKAYSEALASGRRDGTGGLSPRTVHHMHRVLKGALSQAVRWQLLVRNPCDAVDPPKVERSKLNTYSLPQTVEMIEAVRDTRVFVPALLAVLCGLRRGEISALRWGSVDLEQGQLSVVQSVEQMNNSVRLKEPKNGRTRAVALSGTVIEELRQHRRKQAEELLKLGVRLSGETFVCALPDGSMMQPTFITHEWVRVVETIDLPRVRFHDLRHAHGTAMLASGIHPKVASERLGHSKVGITLDLYSHVLPGMQEDAAAKMDAALREAQMRVSKPKG
jgi:integrase